MIRPLGNYPLHGVVAPEGGDRMSFSWSARELAFRLGLGDLQPTEVCHGYANACVCLDCLEREQAPKRREPPPKQPWETAA